MDCRRSEELLSDLHEGTLEEPLLSELQSHLWSCPDCAALQGALGEVVSALRDGPGLEPPAGLVERIALALSARPRPRTERARLVSVPAWLHAAAALLALAVTGATLLAGSPRAGRLLSRTLDRAGNAGAYLLEKKERLEEDVRLLRVVVGTAFEGRLDRMSDRVDDYRRFLERRRQSEEEKKKNRGSQSSPTSEVLAGFSNQGAKPRVTSS